MWFLTSGCSAQIDVVLNGSLPAGGTAHYLERKTSVSNSIAPPLPSSGAGRRTRIAKLLATLATLVMLTTLAAQEGAQPAHADGYAPIFTAVNADGGVYWRADPNWNDAIRLAGHGIYNGDQIALDCYQFGGPVAPYGNTLWYYAVNTSRWDSQTGNYQSGWVNDHFLNTPGTAANPQPQTLPCG